MKLLLVGPSKNLESFSLEDFENHRKEGYTIISYSDSITRLKEINFKPDYYSFYDIETIKKFPKKDSFLNDIQLLVGDIFDDNIDKDLAFDWFKNFKEVHKIKVDKYPTVNAIESTAPPTLTNGVVTSQAGNIVFSKKQADALKDDTVKIYGYGPLSIKSLSGYDVKFSNLKVELTPVTTTTTSSTIGSASTSVAIAERAGIRDDVSTVTGIGIDTSSAIPFVDSGAGTVSGAGTIVLSAAQELESGITLTFGGASRIATITGDIEVLEAGAENLSLRFDLEKILTAT